MPFAGFQELVWIPGHQRSRPSRPTSYSTLAGVVELFCIIFMFDQQPRCERRMDRHAEAVALASQVFHRSIFYLASMSFTTRCWRAHPILWKRWWPVPRLTGLQNNFQRHCKTLPSLMTSTPPTGSSIYSLKKNWRAMTTDLLCLHKCTSAILRRMKDEF